MDQKVRILVVDDDENMRESIARLLEIEWEEKVEIVGFAENGAVAVQRVKELKPDVVLMDINMPVMNGIEATAKIAEAVPGTGIIMLTAQDDSTYLKKAFQANAADYVTKPVNPDELTDAINRFMAKKQPPAQASSGASIVQPVMAPPPPPVALGRVVGVVGFKGGAGKTTLAVNLGVGLAKAGKKVVLIDSDTLFGDVSITLNTRGQRTILDLARMADEADQMESEMVDAVLTPHESGLKLLLAPSNPADFEPISSGAMTNILEFFKKHFEYVIVDTSRNLDEILLATVRTADRLIVLTTPTMSALKDTRLMFAELDSLEAMTKVMLALNQVDRSNTISSEQIANHLKLPIAIQVPFDMTAVNALNSGVALITLDPKRAPAVKPLVEMLQTVVKECEAAGQTA